MDRDRFVRLGRPRWGDLEKRLARRAKTAEDWSELADQYRTLCADLARAQALDLGPDVMHYLDDLAGRAHNRLYGLRSKTTGGIIRGLLERFPRTLRREWRFFLVANICFYFPFIVGIVGPLISSEFAGLVLPEAMLGQMEAMYADDIQRSGFGEDVAMVGFYVMNNVGIAFRCFATGALAGLGSVVTLIYQGLVLGTMEGHLWSVGLGWNLTAFTAGHTAWELTGIVIAGMAGMRMGWALIVTNGHSRIQSLKDAGPIIYDLVLGATAMLFIAAAVEGLWSASPAPASLKIAFGLVGVVVVFVWLVFGGRGRTA